MMEVLYMLIVTLIFLSGFYIGGMYQYKKVKARIEKEQEERVQQLVAYWLGKVDQNGVADQPVELENTYSYQIVEHCLQTALDTEDYEEAARLRDILQNMRDEEGEN